MKSFIMKQEQYLQKQVAPERVGKANSCSNPSVLLSDDPTKGAPAKPGEIIDEVFCEPMNDSEQLYQLHHGGPNSPYSYENIVPKFKTHRGPFQDFIELAAHIKAVKIMPTTVNDGENAYHACENCHKKFLNGRNVKLHRYYCPEKSDGTSGTGSKLTGAPKKKGKNISKNSKSAKKICQICNYCVENVQEHDTYAHTKAHLCNHCPSKILYYQKLKVLIHLKKEHNLNATETTGHIKTVSTKSTRISPNGSRGVCQLCGFFVLNKRVHSLVVHSLMECCMCKMRFRYDVKHLLKHLAQKHRLRRCAVGKYFNKVPRAPCAQHGKAKGSR